MTLSALSQEHYLVIMSRTGDFSEFRLSEKPEISMSDNMLHVSSHADSIELMIENVESFSFQTGSGIGGGEGS